MREDGQRTCFIFGKTPGAQQILMWDDIEGLLKWVVKPGRHRPQVQKSLSVAYHGNHSLGLHPGNIAPDGPIESVCYRDFPLGVCRHIRFELVYNLETPGTPYAWGFYWVKWIDGIQHRAGFRRGAWASEWGYLGSDNVWHMVDGTQQDLRHSIWHRVAFEIDWGLGEYVVLESNGESWDFSGLAYRKVAAGLPEFGQGFRMAIWIAGGGKWIWYDDILVRSV